MSSCPSSQPLQTYHLSASTRASPGDTSRTTYQPTESWEIIIMVVSSHWVMQRLHATTFPQHCKRGTKADFFLYFCCSWQLHTLYETQLIMRTKSRTIGATEGPLFNELHWLISMDVLINNGRKSGMSSAQHTIFRWEKSLEDSKKPYLGGT